MGSPFNEGLAAAWEALLVYDFVIFVLTMFKSRMTLGSNNFVSLMLRDGMYPL